MKGFSKEVKTAVRDGQHGYCAYCTNKIDDFHHMVANTKTNQKLFPLFLQSIFNCKGLCRYCHEVNKSHYHISLDMAREYEEYLRGLKPGETWTR
jgi:sulfatase maturation enzyme AslB (radical SAM superfamily)